MLFRSKQNKELNNILKNSVKEKVKILEEEIKKSKQANLFLKNKNK